MAVGRRGYSVDRQHINQSSAKGADHYTLTWITEHIQFPTLLVDHRLSDSSTTSKERRLPEHRLGILMETLWATGPVWLRARPASSTRRRSPSVPRSVKDPLASNEANVTSTVKVLVAAKDCGVPAVVAASSVYGDTPLSLGERDAKAALHW